MISISVWFEKIKIWSFPILLKMMNRDQNIFFQNAGVDVLKFNLPRTFSKLSYIRNENSYSIKFICEQQHQRTWQHGSDRSGHHRTFSTHVKHMPFGAVNDSNELLSTLHEQYMDYLINFTFSGCWFCSSSSINQLIRAVFRWFVWSFSHGRRRTTERIVNIVDRARNAQGTQRLRAKQGWVRSFNCISPPKI